MSKCVPVIANYYIDGYVIKVDQIDKLPFYLSNIKSKIKDPARVIDLSNIIKPVIRAFHMQKILMILVLSLICAIALFNLVSGTVMLVNEKKSEIAVLRTIGASKLQIVKIFFDAKCIFDNVGSLYWRVNRLLCV